MCLTAIYIILSLSQPLDINRLSDSLTLLMHQEFISEAEGEMKSLLRLYGHMKQEYDKATKFFGEEPAKMRIDEFFGAFASFIEDFKVGVSRNSIMKFSVPVSLSLSLHATLTESC